MRIYLAITALVAGALFTSSSNAGIFLTDVVKVSGNAEVPTIAAPMLDGTLPFTDRDHVLIDVPSELYDLNDPELVQLSNSDKESADHQVDVTLGRLSILYVGIDNRLDGPFDWMQDTSQTGLPSPFFDTLQDMGNDENGDGSANNTWSLWATIAPAGTYSFYEQNMGGGSNMYVIAADNTLLVPEPATLTTMGIGLLGLGLLRRRRR